MNQQAKILFLVSIVVSSLLVIQADEKSREECVKQLSGYISPQPAMPEKPANIADVRVESSESGCYGRCEAYTIVITSSTVTFEGRAYTKKRGKKRAKLSPSEFKDIVNAWYAAKFYAMREDYCSPTCPDGSVLAFTDVPDYSVRYSSKALSKNVTMCAAYINGKPETPVPPKEFRDFQLKLRAIAKSHGWLK